METLQKPTIDKVKLVKNNTVKFDSYRAGFFYYTIGYENETYRFCFETHEIAGATLQKEDKAIMFLRFINKAIDHHQFIKV